MKQTGRELPVRAAPAEAVALHGCVLTPERAIEGGYVVVGPGTEIQAVQTNRRDGVRVHETEGSSSPARSTSTGTRSSTSSPLRAAAAVREPLRLAGERHLEPGVAGGIALHLRAR